MIIEHQRLRDDGQRKGLVIGQEILEETRKCRNDFACLTNTGECLCKTEDFCSDNVCFIKPDKGKFCNYMMSFGYSFVCNCPTRKEIYRHYRI
jgi:hypothetical protein